MADVDVSMSILSELAISALELAVLPSPLTHKHTSNQHYTTSDKVPGCITAPLSHQEAISENHSAKDKDKWEQSNRSLDCAIPSCKLEVDWNVVDRNVDCRSTRRASNEEKNRFFSPHQVNREYPCVLCSEHGKDLLKSKRNEQHSGYNEKRDDGAVIPAVQHASEVDTHNQAYDRSDTEC